MSLRWQELLCRNLHQLQLEDRLCDVTLTSSDGAHIKAHMCVMAATCKNLRQVEIQEQVQYLVKTTIVAGILMEVIHFAYTGVANCMIQRSHAFKTACDELGIGLQHPTAELRLAWSARIADTLWDFKQHGEYCNVTLATMDGDVIVAHACVLSASSATFCGLIAECEPSSRILLWASFSVETLNSVLMSLYTGGCDIISRSDDVVTMEKRLPICESTITVSGSECTGVNPQKPIPLVGLPKHTVSTPDLKKTVNNDENCLLKDEIRGITTNANCGQLQKANKTTLKSADQMGNCWNSSVRNASRKKLTNNDKESSVEVSNRKKLFNNGHDDSLSKANRKKVQETKTNKLLSKNCKDSSVEVLKKMKQLQLSQEKGSSERNVPRKHNKSARKEHFEETPNSPTKTENRTRMSTNNNGVLSRKALEQGLLKEASCEGMPLKAYKYGLLNKNAPEGMSLREAYKKGLLNKNAPEGMSLWEAYKKGLLNKNAPEGMSLREAYKLGLLNKNAPEGMCLREAYKQGLLNINAPEGMSLREAYKQGLLNKNAPEGMSLQEAYKQGLLNKNQSSSPQKVNRKGLLNSGMNNHSLPTCKTGISRNDVERNSQEKISMKESPSKAKPGVVNLDMDRNSLDKGSTDQVGISAKNMQNTHLDTSSNPFEVNSARPRKKTKKNNPKGNHSCPVCLKEFPRRIDVERHIVIHRDRVECVAQGVSCRFCKKVFYNRADTETHERIHSQDRPYVCKLCPQTFRQRSHLNVHQVTHSDVRNHPCRVCKKAFKTSYQLKKHVQNVHSGLKPYECKQCGKSFTRKDTLDKHLKVHAGIRSFQCVTCGKSFSQKVHLKIHELTHSSERPYPCHTCDKAFKLQRHLKHHLIAIHGEGERKWYQCAHCPKKFASLQSRKYHQHVHTGVVLRPHVCQICQTKFKKPGHLQQHMVVHTDNRPHVCNICGSRFAMAYLLVKHAVTHSTQRARDFKCSICEQTFLNKSSCKSHETRHVAEKRHKCDHCSLAFFTAGDLAAHVRRYSGDKPFKCGFCERKYSDKGEMKRHERIHTGLKPHHCLYCRKAFRTPSNCTKHERIHTGETPYKCGFCERLFRVLNSRRDHELRRHKDKVIHNG